MKHLFIALIGCFLFSCNPDPEHTITIINNTPITLYDSQINGKLLGDIPGDHILGKTSIGNLYDKAFTANWGDTNPIVITINMTPEEKRKPVRDFTLSIDNVDVADGTVFYEFKEN